MKKAIIFFSRLLGKPSANSLIIVLLFINSCKKEDTSPVNAILGDYFTERFSCPKGATLFDSFSFFTIKEKSNISTNSVEIHFISARRALWFGQMKGDSLLFPQQTVITTSTEYPTGGVEIKGFGIVKGNIIDFQIDEYYIFNGYRHTCTFSAKRK